MKPRKKKRRVLCKRLGAALLALLALTAFALCYAIVFGIPPALSSRMLARFDPRQFTVETGPVHWQPGQGIIARDVRLYRKFVVGPAAVEADKVTVRLDPRAWFDGKAPVRSLQVHQARIRPEMFEGLERVREPRPVRRTMLFDLTVQQAEVFGMRVSHLRSRLELHGTHVLLMPIQARIEDDRRRGTLEGGRLAYDRNERTLSFAIDARIDPRMLIPVTRHFRLDAATELAQDFNFESPLPQARIEMRAPLGQEGSIHTTVRFHLQQGAFRKAALSRADGSVHIEALRPAVKVTVAPLLVEQDEESASGKFTVNTRDQTVDFDLRSTLPPLSLLRMIGRLDPDEDDRLHPVRFGERAQVAATGTLHYAAMDRSRMAATVSGRDLGYGPFALDEYRFDMHMNGRTRAVDDFSGRMDEGTLTGSGQWMASGPDRPHAHYALDLEYDDACFEKLVKRVQSDKKEAYEGRFSLHLEMEGETGPEAREQARGQGQVRIQKGRVLRLPIFGGLTQTLSQTVPGIDFLSRQDYAVSDFTVADGKIKTDRATIEGSVFRILGHGHYALDGELDFRIQVRFLREKHILRRLLDLPTWALSKFFEFQLKGTPDDPEWIPFGPTMDLLKKIGIGN